MKFGFYRFHATFETGAKLPPYKGSALRGVFGHALKKTACAKPHKSCGTCSLASRCLYVKVFEPQARPAPPSGSSTNIQPNPFVIEPPPDTRREYKPGQRFDFGLALFGEVNRNLPYFVYAFEQAGREGIGQKLNGSRGRFKIENVTCGSQVIYTGPEKFVQSEVPSTDLVFKLPQKASPATPSVRIELRTPLRVKFNNRLNARLPFHVLIRAALRRMSTLEACYGEGEPAVEYRSLVRQAERVKSIDTDLRWMDWGRYSYRQKTEMRLGGMVGHSTYANVPAAYLPLLFFCEKVHIGKQTTFGLGKIRIVLPQQT